MQIDINQFSSREKEVINLLFQGKSNKQIAMDLGVSVSTIEFHLMNVYRKLQVNSRTEAILKLGESTGGDDTGKLRESIVDRSSGKAENSGNTIPKKRIPMKNKFYIVGGSALVIVMVLSFVFARFITNKANILPTETLSVSVTAFPEMSYMGTSFIFPPGLGDGTQNEIVPLSDVFTATYPEHIKLTLVDYPLESTVLEPQILVFPLKEFAQMNKDSETTILNLQNILMAQQVYSPDPLPFLPARDAAQIFHAQEKILAFQNGVGIRYLTQYSQAHFPAINNTDVFYTFQGISNDGNNYVSVMLPIHLDYLISKDDPEAWKNPADWQTVEKYPDYLKTMISQLDQAGNPFSPSLESLDALVQSIQIFTPVMDEGCPTGTADLILYTNTDDGYCLLHPVADIALPPYLIVINPTGMAGDMPGDAWLQISVEAETGRTAAEVADGQIADAGQGFNITRSEILLDGKQAIVVDGLPGPDSWRKVFVVSNEHLYTLYFLPWSPGSDSFTRLEELYSTAIATFHFLPPTP